GLQRDPVTRVERYVGPADLTPTQARQKETDAHAAFQEAVNTALTGADRDLQLVAQLHERLPPLGQDLIIPPNRGGELDVVSTLLLAGTFGQWHAMCQTALDTDDRPLGEVCAFVGKARADEWHANRPRLEADLQALESGFATESSLSGEYAAALVGQMRAALESVSKTLGRTDGVQQLLVSHEPLWNALKPLPAQLDVESHWFSLLPPVRTATGRTSEGPQKLVGDTPATAHLEAIEAEALGPLRSAADA